MSKCSHLWNIQSESRKPSLRSTLKIVVLEICFFISTKELEGGKDNTIHIQKWPVMSIMT